MNLKNLRTNVLIIISLVSLTLFISTEYYQYKESEKTLFSLSIEKLLILTKTMHTFNKVQKRFFRAKFIEIQDNVDLQNAIVNNKKLKMKKELEKYSLKLFRETASLQHILLYSQKGKMLEDLDAQEDIDGEHQQTNNGVLLEALKTKSFKHGYVELENHTYYESLIFPLFQNNHVIAYIEFGLKADSLFKLASKAAKYKYALYLKNQTHNVADARKLGKLFISNSSVFKELKISQKYIYTYANKAILLSHADKDYFLQQYDIESPFQKNFAQVILLLDVTHYIKSYKESLLFSIKMYSIVFFIVFVLIYIVLTKLIHRLAKEESDLLLKQEELEIILDNSNNFITLFDNSKLMLVNQTMLSFFGYSNHLDLFLKDFSQFQTIFKETDETFSFPTAKNNLEWISKIKSLKEESQVVALEHKDLGFHYFNVKVTHLPHKQDSFIVIFSDISSLFQKSRKNSYLAYHDSLTKIYNRQYFHEFTNKTLCQINKNSVASLLMLDIDFFKKVNDTYGHQTGDKVLVQFARTLSLNIRAEDILARWGGEEFVILLRDTTASQGFKIAENLRQKIELADFKEVGNITCSVGLTQAKHKETLDGLVARADKALYKAKESGRNRVEILS